MITAQSTCPCHPGETRDARFAFLDALIDAGWGAVPMYLIERELEKNGGLLPLKRDQARADGAGKGMPS